MVCKAVVSIPLARGEVNRLSCEDGNEPLFGLVKRPDSLNILSTARLSETSLVRGFSIQCNNTLA